MFENIITDYRSYGNPGLGVLVSPGFMMTALYRFGYWTNHHCWRPVSYPFKLLYRFVHLPAKLLTGIDISCFASIGKGFAVIHYGGIFIAYGVKMGDNCAVHQGVTLGNNALAGKPDDVPIVGNHVCLGAGAKIIGKVELGDNTLVGANAVVTKSFPDGNVTLGGIPAVPIISRRASAASENRRNGI